MFVMPFKVQALKMFSFPNYLADTVVHVTSVRKKDMIK